ncbi:MAG: type II toxin-antitoxin system VapB family antitoxin [Propionibacteriaceae bacterium]|nr:type II toxin-antitoxin system VapB family antitoxin [Propionibacteriaceae bacterium]
MMTATVSVFMNRTNQAIRIPKEMSFPGVTRLEATREGDVLTLKPLRPTWDSFVSQWAGEVDEDFLATRPDVVEARPLDLGDDQS